MHRQQALVLRGDGHAGERVHVPDAARVRARSVDRAVDDEAGLVRLVALRLYRVAIEVDLHEVGCSDLVEAQAVRVDEEMVVAAGNARADVRVDQLRPAEMVGDAVRGGELHAQVPFAAGEVRAGGECDAHLKIEGIRKPGQSPISWGGDRAHL